MRKSLLFTLLLSFIVIKHVHAYQTKAKDKKEIDPLDIFNFDPSNVQMLKGSNHDIKVFTESDEVTGEEVPQNVPTPTEACSSQQRQESGSSSQEKQEPGNVAREVSADKNDRTENKEGRGNVDTVAISLLRQYAMTLVSKFESKIKANKSRDISLRFQISQRDIDKLHAFGQEKTADIRDVHEILRNIIHSASDVSPQETRGVDWMEFVMGLSWSNLFQNFTIMLCGITFLTVLWQILKIQSPLCKTFSLCYVISVAFVWFGMYQEKVADQERIFMETMNKSWEKPEEQSFLSLAFSFVSSPFTFKRDKSQEYYQIMFVNPVVKVSPLEALAVALVKPLMAPIGIIGKAISTFLTEVLKDLPVQHQLVALIGILLVFIILVVIFCIYRGYQINIFHLVIIGPGQQPARIQMNTITSKRSVTIFWSDEHHHKQKICYNLLVR
ncbi:unnamed protein product [Lymnaea stagnalis]|uniref:Chloride channel CLIC-like protein 1 n=1 Tax=Lymnaea stagnalis TaxID=6523 RepID=A0AAV2HTE4_LYMST